MGRFGFANGVIISASTYLVNCYDGTSLESFKTAHPRFENFIVDT